MPYKQRTQCRHPGCPVLIPVGGSKYCDKHKQLHPDRPSAVKRGYTSRWQRISRQYLRQHPLCVRCGRPAQVVDHIVPHRGREQLSAEYEDAAAAWAEKAAEIERAVRQLPPKLGELLRLRYVYGLKWEQVNEQLYVSHMTSVRMHRKALELLLDK